MDTAVLSLFAMAGFHKSKRHNHTKQREWLRSRTLLYSSSQTVPRENREREWCYQYFHGRDCCVLVPNRVYCISLFRLDGDLKSTLERNWSSPWRILQRFFSIPKAQNHSTSKPAHPNRTSTWTGDCFEDGGRCDRSTNRSSSGFGRGERFPVHASLLRFSSLERRGGSR